MAESRVKNASRNIAFGLFLKCYQIIVPLLIRTAMMYYMGVNYLGLNGLFTSILLTLEVAELGVGSAMVYSMYKPIIDHDTKTICALLRLYRVTGEKKYFDAACKALDLFSDAIRPECSSAQAI